MPPKENLLMNVKKWFFMKKELVYLGFIISQGGLKMDLEKLEAILKWPTPKNVLEFRSFHGLASFYRKILKNFSGICAPIIETIKKDNQPFYWTVTTDRSFKLLKNKVTEKLVLKLSYFC